MDDMSLRWALIVVGVLIIAGLFLFGNPDKKRKPRASRKRVSAERVRKEPKLSTSADQEAEEEIPDVDERQTELAIDHVEPSRDSYADDTDGRREPRFGFDDESPEPQASDEPVSNKQAGEPKRKASDIPLPDKIVTLFIKARDNHIISGVELLDVTLKSGLVYSDPGIFNRINEEDGKPVFSMANLTNPGTFDKTKWNTIEIRGVTMFMTLPGPKNALDAWDSMLATSRRLAELLHADLLDDRRQIFGRERSLQIKEELREFERQKTEEP